MKGTIEKELLDTKEVLKQVKSTLYLANMGISSLLANLAFRSIEPNDVEVMQRASREIVFAENKIDELEEKYSKLVIKD